jgi:hypothetical protein
MASDRTVLYIMTEHLATSQNIQTVSKMVDIRVFVTLS